MTTHEIYTVLFDRIIRNHYPEDTWLREDTLAREFAVSRSPVRSVLRNLEQDNLIELLPKRGARILPFTADDLEDIYELRESLEILALRRAAQTLSIQQLLSIKSRILELRTCRDYLRHAAVDAELHGYLIRSSGRRRLGTMLNQLYRLTQTFRELCLHEQADQETTISEHLNFIDALCIRNIDHAMELLTLHIRNSKIRSLTKIIEGRVTEIT